MQWFRIFITGAGLALALGFSPVRAQRTASPGRGAGRVEVSFDRGWERFAIDSPNIAAGAGRVRQGTSFTGQFTDEHVSAGGGSSLAAPGSDEVGAAVRGFDREYPLIRSLMWTPVTLPAPARDESELNPGPRQFVGICYYRKRFSVPPDGRTYSLRFDAAMQVASVWVNGRFVLQHQGGYLPFTVPLHPGDSTILVRVDNRNNNQTPPGKPLERLGFLYWSGIYRNVWLVGLPARHIDDVFVRYEDVSSSSATVVVRTSASAGLVRQVLEGRVMAPGEALDSGGARDSVLQRFTVAQPRLWSPEDPHLYVLRTQLLVGGRVVDEVVTRIGIRSLRFTRTEGFLLNGKPYRIVGTNRHQDHPYIGNAVSAAESYRDLKRIKDAGMNFVRLAHYPQDPSVYDACDSLGLMVADAIPGWQFFNNGPRFRARVYRDIRETVRRDRNHPCVVMWEMSLNESYPPDSFRIASARVAHEEYPGDQFFTAGDTYGAKNTAWDVPYNSWEDPFGRPQDVQPLQPGFVREYGHYEFGGEQSTTNSSRMSEASLLHNAWNIQWEHNLLRGPLYYPWTIGDANWAFYDGFEAPTRGTTDWGVMDVFRLPKFSYYFFQSQRDAFTRRGSAPVVFIANWWTPFDTSGKVVVYSNADSVSLLVNGLRVATRRPDDGPDSPYGDWDHGGNPFDGGNGRHLDHPPFTFTDVAFTPGSLRAVGYFHGDTVSFVRHTPG
ncbi:MAG TPA: glycoside hydrolase family 2 TIM barrel-domain containing protein, partial [Dinghuibacter sp.]|uniref:glycoside hydrolase family 2 protein n=1 Tax=Dinghuibacter sp. TaxID=2024697 RepID=UPI002BD9FF45